jgi:hypothetical protein
MSTKEKFFLPSKFIIPPYPLPNNMNKRLQCAKIGSPVLCTWRVYFSSDFEILTLFTSLFKIIKELFFMANP